VLLVTALLAGAAGHVALRGWPAALSRAPLPAPVTQDTPAAVPARLAEATAPAAPEGEAPAGNAATPAIVPPVPPDAPPTTATTGTDPNATAAAPADTARAADAIAIRQVDSASWGLTLPFEAAEGGAAPVVTRILDAALQPPENAWLAEGVALLAVNGIPVADQASVERVLTEAAGFGVEHLIHAPARIQRPGSGTEEEVILAARARLNIALANGVRLRTEGHDGGWQTSVTAVAAPEEGGLQPGDRVLGELVSGEALTELRALELAINRLAQADRPVAIFEIEREGRRMTARMALARGGR